MENGGEGKGEEIRHGGGRRWARGKIRWAGGEGRQGGAGKGAHQLSVIMGEAPGFAGRPFCRPGPCPKW